MEQRQDVQEVGVAYVSKNPLFSFGELDGGCKAAVATDIVLALAVPTFAELIDVGGIHRGDEFEGV